MNDKIKQFLQNAEQSDAIAKNKWRIENREQLRKERKEKLKELMEKDKQQTAVEWFAKEHKKFRVEPWKYVNSGGEEAILKQAKEMEKSQSEVTENTSDGYHTFKTLYAIRKAYNVALFNEWGSQMVKEKKLGGAIVKSVKYHVHKSRRHHDGEYPFGKDNWFIVCAMLPTGQISNHYPIEDWDLFQIPETEKALFPFDGHTTEDVIERLLSIK